MTSTIELYRELDEFAERTEEEDARWEAWESVNHGWLAFGPEPDEDTDDNELF
jgi:hypothetical protein